MSFELPFMLVAVFLSVALGIGALLSFALTWTTAEQREIRRLSERGDGVLAQLNLAEVPGPMDPQNPERLFAALWDFRFRAMLPPFFGSRTDAAYRCGIVPSTAPRRSCLSSLAAWPSSRLAFRAGILPCWVRRSGSFFPASGWAGRSSFGKNRFEMVCQTLSIS